MQRFLMNIYCCVFINSRTLNLFLSCLPPHEITISNKDATKTEKEAIYPMRRTCFRYFRYNVTIKHKVNIFHSFLITYVTIWSLWASGYMELLNSMRIYCQNWAAENLILRIFTYSCNQNMNMRAGIFSMLNLMSQFSQNLVCEKSH